MSKSPKPDYDVGYAKPPRHSQFKKGQSGNAAGRPKGRLNLATEFERALSATVTVTEGGRRLVKTKLEVMLVQLINKAVGGDLKALHMTLNRLAPADTTGAGEPLAPDLAADRELAVEILRRFGGKDNNIARGPNEPEAD